MYSIIKQTTKRFWIVISILMIGIMGIFPSSALAVVNDPPNGSTSITGKDLVGGGFPLTVSNTATSSENTWGRVIRITGKNPDTNSYFDLGIDDKGNFFINSPIDTKTSHSLLISPKGIVTVNPPR
jgi:hypothetical protein